MKSKHCYIFSKFQDSIFDINTLEMNSVPVGQIVEENGQVRIVVERTKKIVKFEIRTANNFQNSNGKESGMKNGEIFFFLK